uniref:Uncharacterized protein n=1 Tax=Arundo donax TaxID=35708 RepID=A0A0A9D6W7_ARUDO
MLLPTIVHLPYFTILGPVLQSLLYHLPSIRRHSMVIKYL